MKLKSVNAVYFGRSSKKGTPYIRVLCVDETGQDCSWTGWLTENTEESIRETLSAFKFSGSIKELIDINDEKERAEHLRPPNTDVHISEDEYNKKVYRKIESIEGLSNSPQKFPKDELKNDWNNFDTKTKTEQIPF